MSIRSLKYILFGPVLALLLLGNGFAYDLDEYDTSKYDISKWVPKGQPAQIKSKVNYDPNLSDPFFESNKWSYPWGVHRNKDGSFEDMTSDKKPKKEPPRIKHTAKCFDSFNKLRIDFCYAKLLADGKLELFIRSDAVSSNLRIVVQNGEFQSQYWHHYPGYSAPGLRWITRKQKLTLSRQTYTKGDEIKGRIVVECAEEIKDPPVNDPEYPDIIKLEGVFKTIIK
jgi:hypothetical protein